MSKLFPGVLLVFLSFNFFGSPLFAQTSTKPVPKKTDVSAIPVSNAALGEFPYIQLPAGLKLLNSQAYTHQMDFLFFPVDGQMQRLEGKVWRAFITDDGSVGNGWSYDYFERKIIAAITQLGGVKLFAGKVRKAELDRIKEDATYFGDEGSIDYWNNKVLVYMIRRQDGHNIYCQFSGNSAGGQLQVLQQ
ncbi:hypothetical protein [Taibaiella chishuiensis]|uniref:Uncharacterized protein n=1 Tax=Taibaiella chishuiensis TaxID=1434707 RepID=A0A2P8D2Z9_9BACT|nr:hypothetical protein [Taibaiella chishuiensis]PSK91559.1 hypothetical protein B0I18_105142 [Taibaiella chishuiensis]